ncbi:LppM family (lipo)protein [Cellulomonas chengniuliangii]|uniref:LppM domain-containing protein n=1 Tax=Cellulomonas chengniuliangii TaxID=2968084 RepID=A0ABY5KYE3_9CELL|nr:hypothetical protein [Cellulomonas chengniuliangii]MCC2307719.1 hypothetical protein [Cellulomonas chengniuliangii]UUI75522.1 hypothetical protein NP064_00915 [Cellulomonas chengniuliangii]
MPRRTAAVALVALVTLGLAGCVRVDLATTLHPDDTQSGSLTFAVSEEFAERSGVTAEALVESLQLPALAGDVPGATVESFTEAGFAGKRVTVENAPLDTFGNDGSSVEITRDGDQFVVSGAIDVSDAMLGGPAGGAEGADLDELDVRVRITFPGVVVDHNGELDGRTVTWHAVRGDRLTLSAQGYAIEGAVAPPPDRQWMWLAGGVVALALALAGAAFARARHTGHAPDADAGPPTAGRGAVDGATDASPAPQGATAQD